jgi:hypothetical protein
MPCTLLLRLGQLSRHSCDDEADHCQAEQPAQPAQSTHTSIEE